MKTQVSPSQDMKPDATPSDGRHDDAARGATSLEWALLLGVIALPAWFVLDAALDLLVGHYALMTTLNALPFP